MPAEAPTSGLFVVEPAGSYARRPAIVVDCSVVAAALFDEVKRDDAAQILAGHELFAPYLLDHELVNISARKARHGLKEAGLIAVTDLAAVPITRCRVDTVAQWRTALEFGLTGYDAAYLQLALDLGAPLATFDQRLGEAALKALRS